MKKVSSSSSSGVGFFGLFFLVLLTLKLTGTIALSWLWITAPLWGVALLVIIITGFLIAFSDDSK